MSAKKTLLCKILTPERTLYDKEVETVVVPAFDGELGIQKAHAKLVAQLSCGECRISVDEKIQRFYIEGGVVKINTTGKGEELTTEVIILTDIGLTMDEVEAGKDDYSQDLEKARALKITDEHSFKQRSLAIRAAEKKIALLTKTSADKSE